MTVLLDTNIFIYLTNNQLDRTAVANVSIAYASITKIESLGFPELQANELLLLSEFFEQSLQLPLTEAVIDRAIKLRQLKRTGLGDAIIAATALEHGMELWTANTKDFSHIAGLKLRNPLNESE